MPFLVFCHLRKRATWHVSVELDAFTVGSSRRATVTVADAKVAAEQIAVRRSGDGFRMECLAGPGQTLLNGAPAGEGPLTTGDRIRLGDTFMLFASENRPSEEEVDRFESILDREIFAPACVEEALQADTSAASWNWPVLIAFAMAGLAVGVLLAAIARLLGR